MEESSASASASASGAAAADKIEEEVARAVEEAKELSDAVSAHISRNLSDEQPLRQRALRLDSKIHSLRSSLLSSKHIDPKLADKVVWLPQLHAPQFRSVLFCSHDLFPNGSLFCCSWMKICRELGASWLMVTPLRSFLAMLKVVDSFILLNLIAISGCMIFFM